MRVEKKVCARCGKTPTTRQILCLLPTPTAMTSKGMREMNYQDTQQFERATMLRLPIQPLLVLCGVSACLLFLNY